MKIAIQGITGVKTSLKTEITRLVKAVAEETLQSAKRFTPVRSGNARRNWTKSVTPNDFQVQNRVPYIERLEAGASKQAPKGIIGPTLTQVKGKFK